MAIARTTFGLTARTRDQPDDGRRRFEPTGRRPVFSFAIEPVNLIDFVPIFFKHLETPDAVPDVRIEIRQTGENNIALVVDGIERLRTCDAGQLIGAVNQTILEHIHPGIEWLAIIHGAAVARDGEGWAIPAACGSGKTALTAYLLARGFDYLADDHVALSAQRRSSAARPICGGLGQESGTAEGFHFSTICLPR